MIKKLPVEKFKDLAEAKKYLEEWKHTLFLDDWFIKLILEDKEIDCLENRSGCCDYVTQQHSAKIRLAHYLGDDFLVKQCEEVTLVHELLHCKKGYMSDNDIVNIMEEQQIEDMAKSLIICKYNLPREWFKNY